MDAITQPKGYRLNEKIYEGSRTLVYRGLREHDQQPVVIKFINDAFPSFNELIQFSNQYSIAKDLNLPNLVRPLALIPYGNASALVMEDFGGIDLNQFLEQASQPGNPYAHLGTRLDRKLGNSRAGLILFFQIAVQVAQALAGISRASVIHKDIKPANILIHPQSGQVKLIDFSIASALPREVPREIPRETQEIQNPNILAGTLAYLSPEQTGRMNRGIDYRSDFYSFGVTCYELLTGQLPFVSPDPMEIVHGHLAKLPVSPYKLSGETMPKIVSDLVLKLMAKNAEDRYQSAFGLKHDLERCLHELKGTNEIEPFKLGQKDASDRFLLSEKLYGRQTEVSHLLAAFHRASLGNTELMLIAGASGMGKTAVVGEVHKPIVQQRGYFIQGKYDQLQRNVPLSAFVQAFSELIKQLLRENDARLQQWQEQIIQALGENIQAFVDIIPDLASIVGPVVKKTTEKHAPALQERTVAENRLNLAIQKFVEIFTRSPRPLVIFLDDLQWADTASLNLLQLLMKDDGHLLIIGAYRDNEVSLEHPLTASLEAIRTDRMQAAQKPNINLLTLSHLSLLDLTHLIADTLYSTTESAEPLAELIYEKTGGNPFFAAQLLITLQAENHIHFSPTVRQWQYSLSQINAALPTNNVLDLMSLRLQKLPPNAQALLQLAACIGAQFELATLATAAQQPLETVAKELWLALQAELVVPVSDSYRSFSVQNETVLATVNPTYRFFHDRIQQAAYGLMSPNRQAETHRCIGQRLLQQSDSKQQDFAFTSQLFDITNHLNRGIALIATEAERDRLIALNLSAGQKAKATYAYSAALNYLETGISLLPPSPNWQNTFALALHNEAAEVSYFTGDLVAMQAYIDEILQQQIPLLNKIRAHEIHIQATISQNYFLQSVETTLQLLAQLGETIPHNPQPYDIQQELQATARKITQHTYDKGPKTLANLPKMEDPRSLVIVSLLNKAISAAYIAKPEVLPLLICTGINRCLAFGNSPLSAFLYTWYGVMLCNQPDSIQQGYQIGELALALLEKMPASDIQTRVVAIVYFLIHPWKAPLRESLRPLAENYPRGLDSGDNEYAAWSLCNYCYHSYLSGVNLNRLSGETARDRHRISTLQQNAPLGYVSLQQQVVFNLLGQTPDPTVLEGQAFSETATLPVQLAANDMTGLALLYINKGMLAYLFAQPEKAHASFETALRYLSGITSSQWLTALFFYDSLACLALPDTDLLLRVELNQEKLKAWAQLAPANQLHRWHLVEAERCRVSGDKANAMDHYDQAIAFAKANKFIQEEAIAHELAAQFYLLWNKGKVAQSYVIDAYYAYSRWGSASKVADLERRYPNLLEATLAKKQQHLSSTDTILAYANAYTNSTTSTNTSGVIDITTLLHTSQVLSSEIEIEKLLTALLEAVIKNAGADKCALLMPTEKAKATAEAERWVIEAFSELDKPPMILESVAITTGQRLPATLINQVRHTRQPVVVFNAAVHPNLSVDPYVLQRQPKSILCMPILNQSKLIAILYLENSLTIGAFTDRRVEILNLICTQAAISLENARLYQQAQHALEELQTSHMQLVQSEKMSALGNLVAGVAHEINNPVNFLKGNLKHALNYVQDILSILDLVVENEPRESILDEMQEIDLDFIREDLPSLLSSMQCGISRIQDISTSLRTFSRADKEHKTAFNLHEGLDSTLLILKHRLQPGGTRLPIKVIKHYATLPEVHCFAGQLNQVFMNLIANAIEAIAEDSAQWTIAELKTKASVITITTEVIESRWVRVAIADTGPGMAPEVKAKVFDHLFTTKPVGKGTGLGLAISHAIITEKHSGTLTVNSTLGQGTEFVITLPIEIS